MNLIYVLILFTGPTWHSSVEVYQTTDAMRCEAIAAQLQQFGRYECRTLVKP